MGPTHTWSEVAPNADDRRERGASVTSAREVMAQPLTNRIGILLPGIVASLLAYGCAEGVSVRTATNSSASFDRYRTFSFGPAEEPPPGYRKSSRSAEAYRRLEPIIEGELVEKGYAHVAELGDLIVEFGSGRRTVTAREVSSARVPDEQTADSVTWSLVIDAFDATTGVWVWHGVSRVETDSEHVDDALRERSAEALLASFPSRTIWSDWPPVTRSARR